VSGCCDTEINLRAQPVSGCCDTEMNIRLHILSSYKATRFLTP
jgi:hypothetical protein